MAYDDDKDDTDDRTIYVGNLSEKMTDAILSELFLQAGELKGKSSNSFVDILQTF